MQGTYCIWRLWPGEACVDIHASACDRYFPSPRDVSVGLGFPETLEVNDQPKALLPENERSIPSRGGMPACLGQVWEQHGGHFCFSHSPKLPS